MRFMPIVPQEMITRIGRAHLAGQRVLVESGMDVSESIDVALAVESYRWFWKPVQVKTMLIAESHFHTTQEELGRKVKSQWLKLDGQASPNCFARTPYCLGSGEPDLVAGLPKEDNAVNWQYWDLFGKIANTGECPDRKASLTDRLEWKAKTLKALRASGIWMVDASLHGRQPKETAEVQLASRFYRSWWDGYGEPLWLEEGKPRLVVIGRGLYRALQEAGVQVEEWLYLPAGMREADQKEHQMNTITSIQKLSSVPNF